MGYTADCYVLTNKRTEAFVEKFLDYFVPKREERATVYEVPQYGDITIAEFTTAEEIVKYLVDNKTVEYAIYWKNLEESDVRGAELFFTEDSYLIIGLSCEAKDEVEDKIFEEIKEFCGSDEGYITYEDTPPHNSIEFRKLLENNKA